MITAANNSSMRRFKVLNYNLLLVKLNLVADIVKFYEFYLIQMQIFLNISNFIRIY